MQNLIQKTNAKDASGNVVFGDIGVHIQQEVGVSVLMWLWFSLILRISSHYFGDTYKKTWGSK